MRPRFAVTITFMLMLISVLHGATCGLFEENIDGYAVVNDVTASRGVGSGYRLAAVDGHEVKRVRGRFIAMIPYALVPPGKRVLSVELDASESPGSMRTFVANLQDGKRYRFKLDDDTLGIVVDSRS
ncbi:hypothetical protein [Crateriforma conspicua]|uniref:hypothetical protein n=1 Tax=Crateriforma conspicua TaxID=2527996 RepID=UPI00118C0894|nr:hypothetical protein [Crateriforma conspicua]QDV61654.1 hypothetical protein Mal65_07810 [Crateriforma conspicua]